MSKWVSATSLIAVFIRSILWTEGALPLNNTGLAYTSPGCPPEFVNIDGICYYVSTVEVWKWEDAWDICRKKDAHLISLETQEKALAISDYLYYNTWLWRWFWIGGNDKAQEGNFIWIKTGNRVVNSYVNWCSYPDNSNGNEDCMMMWEDPRRPTAPGSVRFCWNDMPCTRSSTLGYICETPPYEQ